jgi:hypothetical protein
MSSFAFIALLLQDVTDQLEEMFKCFQHNIAARCNKPIKDDVSLLVHHFVPASASVVQLCS